MTDYHALNKLTNKFPVSLYLKLMGCLTYCRDHNSSLALILPLAFISSYCKRQTKERHKTYTWLLPVQGIALWPDQCTSHTPSHHEQGV